MHRIVLLLALICLPGMSLQAADSQNRFALKGAGFLPCGVFLQERQRKSNVYYMVGGWLEGYISAHNRYTTNTYDVAAFESLELLLGVVEKHCSSRPRDRLHAVVSSMVEQLHPQRVVEESPRLEIADETRKTQLYRETVRRMQAKLTELGLYKAEVDGRYTDATKAALIAYQSDLEFEETGFPDQTTLWRLLRN